MSDIVITAVIAAAPPTIAAIAALIVSLRTRREVVEVKKATNGLTDRLVAATAREHRAVGILEGESHVPRPPLQNDPRERFKP